MIVWKKKAWWTKVLQRKTLSFYAPATNENKPSVQVLLSNLKACSKTRNLERGKQVHAKAIECGHHSESYVASALINMYARTGSMLCACQVFNSVKDPDVVSWTALILGYAENGQGLTALDLFAKMKIQGPKPNSVTLLATLKACISLVTKGVIGWEECRKHGKEIHQFAMKIGCDADHYMQNTLIDMYAKCSSMLDARQIFDDMKNPDVVTWSVLMLGYAENGQGLAVLDMFERMKVSGPAPNPVTLLAVLKACTSLEVKRRGGCRERGKEIQELAVEIGCDLDINVQNTLIDMYAKCGYVEDARELFDKMKSPNVVSWNALILGYAANGQVHTALDLLKKMITGGPAPNSVTLLAALKACTSLAVEGVSGCKECRDRGKYIHDLAVLQGCDSSMNLQNALIDMYAKCNSIVDAHRVFDSLKHPNVVSWTALILGYADNGQGLTAMDLFARMRTRGPAADSVTFSAVLKACGMVGGLEFGRRVHSEIDKRSHLDMVLVNSLVDFYAKCGSLVEAQRVFSVHTKTRNLVTWTALLAGFSSIGDHKSVFGLFGGMQDAGLEPDSVTFISMLTCCSHAGLVDKGKECFDAMSTKYRIIPTVEHYTCMVDIFGRANKLHDAMALLHGMHCSPNNVTWKTVLGACRKWKNVETGRLVFQSLIHLNKVEPGAYVLMGQIYGSRGMLQEQEMVLEMREGN